MSRPIRPARRLSTPRELELPSVTKVQPSFAAAAPAVSSVCTSFTISPAHSSCDSGAQGNASMTPSFCKVAAAALVTAGIAASASGQQFHRPDAKASTGLVASAASANAKPIENIIVTYDQSTLLPLPRPAAEIIIGNASIADVSVQSTNMLIITGKSFGITNMIVLDAKREIIFEKRLQVKREEAMVLNLQRGTLRQTYNCTPQCNPTVTVGDDQNYFDAVVKASEKKQGLSEKASDGGAGN